MRFEIKFTSQKKTKGSIFIEKNTINIAFQPKSESDEDQMSARIKIILISEHAKAAKQRLLNLSHIKENLYDATFTYSKNIDYETLEILLAALNNEFLHFPISTPIESILSQAKVYFDAPTQALTPTSGAIIPYKRYTPEQLAITPYQAQALEQLANLSKVYIPAGPTIITPYKRLSAYELDSITYLHFEREGAKRGYLIDHPMTPFFPFSCGTENSASFAQELKITTLILPCGLLTRPSPLSTPDDFAAIKIAHDDGQLKTPSCSTSMEVHHSRFFKPVKETIAEDIQIKTVASLRPGMSVCSDN